ncbi:MAG: NnrU family protein, partial [Alphaproteobacteria bacterium]
TAGMERTIEARDPVKGIVTITRHPMLWAFALWALAHLVNKGDRASIVFFGALACLSLFGQVLIDRKKERQLGAAWGPFALRSSAIPFVAALQGRTRIDWRGIGWWRPALGLVLYAGFLFGHQAILGKSPWPL